MASIVILDGCPLTRECLSMLLRAEGHKVLTAPDIAQAKSLLAKRVPDILLCELVAPDGSSLGLLRSFKQDKRFIAMRVCVLTNIAAKTPLTQAVEAGVSAVILKSRFSYKQLVRQLNDLSQKGTEKDASGGEKIGTEPQRFALPMPAPDHAQELRQHKPVLTRPELEQALEEHPRVECSARVIEHVRSVLASPECEMESLSNALHGDPGLMTRLYREANTKEEGCEEPANGVFDALLRVGLDRLKEILDEVCEEEPTSKASPEGSLTTDQLRAHGLVVGVIASKIATQCHSVDPRWAMTGGLLHDVGRLHLLGALGNKLTGTVDTCAEIGVPLHAGEKRMLLTEHDKLAMTMSNAWNLPREITQAIGYHHEEHAKLGGICNSAPKLAASIALADQIAHAMGCSNSGSTTIEPCETLFEMLENDEITLGSIQEGLGEQIEQAFKLAGLGVELLSDGVQHPMPDQTLHPAFISMNPETDIYAQWLASSFGELAEGQSPNIAIVHVRQAKDRNELGDALKRLQNAQTDSDPLPVLILSPTGRNGLAEEVMTRHPCMHLRTPFGVSVFERAVNALMSGQQQYQQPSGSRMAA